MSDSAGGKRRAEAFFREKKYSEALEVYRSLHSATGESKYVYNVAICFYHMSRIGDAAAILEKMYAARELFPDSGLFLGFCYRSLNQFGRGRVHFESMAESTTGAVRAKCRLMAALLTDEAGEPAAAETAYEKLMSDPEVVGKTRAEVLRRLATLKETKKEHLTALHLYRESLTHDTEGEAALAAKFRIAVCLIELSTPAESVELLREVETAAKGSFLGESAAKLLKSVESSVHRLERKMRAYE